MATLLISLVIIGLVAFSNKERKDYEGDAFPWFQNLFIGCAIGWLICMVAEVNSDDPRLDVYRGKTELQINGFYRDSVFVPTDSVVIYKKRENGRI